MREWEEIVERIQAALQAEAALHEAEVASADAVISDPFKAKMEELGSHLEWLKDVLAHVDQYALEELVDAFLVGSGNTSRYHRFIHDVRNVKK